MNKMYDLADKYLPQILIDREMTHESVERIRGFFTENRLSAEKQIFLINKIIEKVVKNEKFMVHDETIQYLEVYLVNIFLKSVFKYCFDYADEILYVSKQDNQIIVTYNYFDCNRIEKTIINCRCIVMLEYTN